MQDGFAPEAVAEPAIALENCYAEIRQIARRLVRGMASAPFQPTELVHEAALRLLSMNTHRIQDERHMLAISARVMRHALIDEVRKLGAAKRQARQLMTLWPEQQRLVPLDVLDTAINELTRVSADHAEIVELRFMLGMTVEEVAATTGLSARTIKRRWQAARAWLQRHLEKGD